MARRKKPLPPHKTGDLVVFQKDFGEEENCVWSTEKHTQRYSIPKGCTAYVLKHNPKTGQATFMIGGEFYTTSESKWIWQSSIFKTYDEMIAQGGDETLRPIKLPWSINFSHLQIPMVRRVMPNLIANEIVSVQPMALPSGSLFFLDYKYGENKT